MRTALLAILLGAAGCTHSGPPPGPYVAPTRLTVLAESEPTLGGQDIYVVNNSSVPVIVTSVRLQDCVNIRNPCTQIPLKITINPRNRRVIARIRPSVEEREYHYRYSWTWSGASEEPAEP